ncbi:MAG TPA: 3-dehydroquinate synthase [Allosphingosinicella sp.]|nr:3-dehydroquinate synthase [Allosphingosinicella sp.]
MRRIAVDHRGGSYDVLIEHGLLEQVDEHLRPYARDGRVVVVADDGAWAAQGARLAASDLDIELIPVAAGEASKGWERLEALVERLLALGVERGDHIVAFGGGMVGDLAGFAASILKRGCGVVQMPTTLLAHVDSSVGGKTGINAGGGKNMVGTFHQPAAVLIDPSTLDTLPGRELRAGYAETVKYGLIGDPEFFAWCEENGAALLAGNAETRTHAIETCVRAKAAVVAQDERETSGVRALLNLGHTFGHAIEAEAGLSDEMLHGEAVAIGMVLAFRFSAERGLCSDEDARRVETHLRDVGLPTGLPEGQDATALVRHMARDKKRADGRTAFVLARGIGKAFVDGSVDVADVEDFLRRRIG